MKKGQTPRLEFVPSGWSRREFQRSSLALLIANARLKSLHDFHPTAQTQNTSKLDFGLNCWMFLRNNQAFIRGAGGSRTRVQTRNSHAFYMLISESIVGSGKERNKPALFLVPIVFGNSSGPWTTYLKLYDASSGTTWENFPGRQLVFTYKANGVNPIGLSC